MQVFKDYAAYYDLLYKDKNYIEEVNYIDNRIREYDYWILKQVQDDTFRARTILEMGCGTGKHAALLVNKGYNLTGVDFSQSMINLANQRLADENISKTKLDFLVGDARNISLNKRFDIVLSLFHVVSYMVTDLDITKMFKTVSDHLNKGGIFIFDCWYGPAVLANEPEKRVKELENESFKLKRFATPVHDVNKKQVDVKYDISLEDKLSGNKFSFNELHKMRYLFKPELELFLKQSGLELVKDEEWLTGKDINKDTWGACFICRKL